MSKAKAELSVTKRMLLEFIKFKSNNGHQFFMGNEKIAHALDLTTNSAKVMVNDLIRQGYLIKDTDNKGRRLLSVSEKEYTPVNYIDMRNIEKHMLKQDAINFQEEAKYYKQELTLANIRIETLSQEKETLNAQLLQIKQYAQSLKGIFTTLGLDENQINELISYTD